MSRAVLRQTGPADRPEPPTRVLLVDDHDVVRKGLRLLLESEFSYDVVEASSGSDAIQWAQDESVHIVLMDVRMPEGDGLWALREIRKRGRDVPVLMLSTFADEDQVQTAIDGGANGYVLKESTTHQLREAIETARSGKGLYLHPAVASRVLSQRRTERHYAELLSDRELAVLHLVAQGATNEQIASQLYVSEKTVKSHLSSIFRKLEVTNRTQAAAKAIREKIVRVGEVEQAFA